MRRQLEVPRVQSDKVYDIQDFNNFVCGCVALITLILGLYFAYCQIRWDFRIREWDKVEGTIVRNDEIRIDESHTLRWYFRSHYYRKPIIHTVSDIKYEYTYKGEKYYGTKIAYERDYFPDGKAGDHRQVIVNPEDPKDCAIISCDPRVTEFLRRFCKSIIFFAIFLASVCGPLLSFYKKRKRNRPEEW